MEQKRYFGTYNGEMVEYRHPSNGDTRYVILKNGDNVQRTKITPSPYPWQFHTREFWDAHPGMRWAFWSLLCDAWFLCGNEEPRYENKSWYGKAIFETFDFLPMWQGDPAASLFENPFFRHYPAELDDPKTWEQWPDAICGAWDRGGRFYCYSVIPKPETGRDGSCWLGEMIKEDESAFNGTFAGNWRDSLIMRPAALPDVLLSPGLYEQVLGRGKRPAAKVPMVKHPKAAPKQAGKPLSVFFASRSSIVFVAKTEAAKQWLNEQAPMFGKLTDFNYSFCLITDTPHAAMRYLIDGFYNRQPDVIRKHYPDVTAKTIYKGTPLSDLFLGIAVAEPESGPRTEKRTIDEITDGTLCNGKITNEFRIYLKKDGICTDHVVTRDCLLDLMRRFDLVYYRALIGKEITVRIDADKLVIVEDGE